jgi:hypothetical protein
MNILFLAASPLERVRIRIDREIKVIQQELSQNDFSLFFNPAASAADFFDLLYTKKPDIVHISTHGTEEGLELENSTGRTHDLVADVLTRLFQECNTGIQCVVLNACQSEGLAEEISQHIDYVIGMSGSIRDSSAIEFSRGLYKALAHNRSIKSAFEAGRLAIGYSEYPEDQRFPVLKQRSSTLDRAPCNPDVEIAEQSGCFYIIREFIETRACRKILERGALLRIMGSRHMGKTSLINHVLSHAGQQGYPIVSLKFTQEVTDLNQLLRRLCVVVGKKLNLPDRTTDYWDDTGYTDDCSSYFEDYLLPRTSQPLVLCLDDFDLLFRHTQVTNELLSLFRAWHEDTNPVWEKLRLIVAYKGSLPKQGLFLSPLANLGEPIELRELTPNEVDQLARRQGLNLNADSVTHLMSLVGGHPYLIQKAFIYLVERRISVEQFVQSAYRDSDHYRTHLKDLWGDIEGDRLLVDEFRKVVQASQPIRVEDSQVRDKLHAFGLINLEGISATLRNELYRWFKEYF